MEDERRSHTHVAPRDGSSRLTHLAVSLRAGSDPAAGCCPSHDSLSWDDDPTLLGTLAWRTPR